ncbi:MAG: electron transport complex subunit RsxC [Candidatus Omnitrophota bacterium]|nr:electron transport complex subunit RsxC [Candidatus Omnitrophota bacterium]
MIAIEEHKELTEHIAIKDASLPDKVFIPLAQHLGKPCNVVEVKVGDTVKTGQRLAVADSGLFSPVHASISGKVRAIADYLHPVLGMSKAIAIERDLSISEEILVRRSEEEASALSIEELKRMIQEAGIVGMGGAAFPAYVKLSPPKPVDSFILNGAECEPYLTADSRLMIEETDGILKGVAIIAKILNVKNIYIAIEDNKPEAIKQFTVHSSQFTVKVLKTKYPQGAEKQLIDSVLRRKVPPGKLPFDVGVVVHNVATAFAIYEAIYKYKPLFERVVTVTGSILENPANLRVRIGTPIAKLIESCGPLKKEPKKIIMGGPMMGLAQFSQDVPVIKGTGGILLLGEDEIEVAEEEACLRCGECIKNCPMGLTPALISVAVAKEKWGLAKEYGALDCIECGLCAYNCPANRNIVQGIKQVKAKSK